MRRRIPVLLMGSAVAMVLFTGLAHAGTCEKWAGKVVSAQGVVEAKRAGQTSWEPVKPNETFCPGDTIRTDRKSRADIALYNHPVLRLDQNSTVALGGMKDEKTSLVDLLNGAALFFSRVTRNLEVRTATVNAGVEGTEFFIGATEGKTDLTVFEGKVLASNAAGGLPVTTGQSAVAEAGKAPVYRVVVRPRDAVQWALYYPPILFGRPADLKEESGDPRFFAHRASQLLAVGRVDEATADIERAQKLDPKNSDALALRSIIAVTRNEKEKALDLARQAATADPKSATARIARSYAQQAHFDLPGALKSLEEAVALEPGNALAWARLAEMHQSFGELDKSLGAARKAESLRPDLSRTQTVLGFAHLTRVNTREALKAFDKAIELDQADPLPRLGLGLTMIREGKLETGRRELEIAVTLDPDSSILRSYLGKAYFEEKRDKLATSQFDMAKNLDPLDPTPFFYDAIQKQTTNQPVEALQDLRKAIELNDNRAVYRSSLLLDSDLAARSASLARIYSDLGFQDLALVEGWNSVNTDPANHSAHRFLADSYSALPRHEIARVSELLQAQLLQPINLSPLQPSLAESNLFVVAGGGPASLSFNEFNPLFQRDRFSLQANGIVGENATNGEEIVASGLYRMLSLSGGWYHYETDGFRTNNDLKDDIFNFFAQASISPKTSIQAEFRYRETEKGFLQLRFLPDDFSPNYREKDRSRSVRLGFHHAFSPGSDLIGSFIHQKINFDVFDVIDPAFVPSITDVREDKSYSGEFQYLYGSHRVKIITGAGYFKTDSDDMFTTTLLGVLIDPTLPPDLFLQLEQKIDSDIRHKNIYAYFHVNYPKTVTWTLGGSGDFFSNEGNLENKIDQFNPKFGVTWNPVPNTTIRAAAFRVLKRTLITNQTLEPTQVAGFNQFFDDPEATKAWRYGAAVDQRFARSVYAGAEYSLRELDVPFQDLSGITPVLGKVDWKERVGRAYLYWAPHPWLALNSEYLYERFEREDKLAFGAREVTTHRIPVGANFFHPSGLSAMFKATHIDQQGSFEPNNSIGTFTDGGDHFWLVDAAIGYRLPQRLGILSIGAKNLFDKSFQFFDTDPVNPAIQPARMFFARVTLSL